MAEVSVFDCWIVYMINDPDANAMARNLNKSGWKVQMQFTWGVRTNNFNVKIDIQILSNI